LLFTVRLWFISSINLTSIYLFIYLFNHSFIHLRKLRQSAQNGGAKAQFSSFYSTYLNLEHPFTIIDVAPSIFGISTFVITLFQCREQHCDLMFKNIFWCHNKNNARQPSQIVSFVKLYQRFKIQRMYLD
jgi:hypothetical protein